MIQLELGPGLGLEVSVNLVVIIWADNALSGPLRPLGNVLFLNLSWNDFGGGLNSLIPHWGALGKSTRPQPRNDGSFKLRCKLVLRVQFV